MLVESEEIQLLGSLMVRHLFSVVVKSSTGMNLKHIWEMYVFQLPLLCDSADGIATVRPVP